MYVFSLGGVGGEGVGGLGLGFTNPVGTRGVLDLCLGCGGEGGEWVGVLEQGLEEWAGLMCVCVVSKDYLCRWQVQVSVYYAGRTPAHLRCTKCSILLHLIDICFLPCTYL